MLGYSETPPDPSCMEPDELAGWRHLNDLLRVYDQDAAEDPCGDCTVAFSLTMQAEGRCNGIPGMTRKAARIATPSRAGLGARTRYWRERLRDMGLDPAHAEQVG